MLDKEIIHVSGAMAWEDVTFHHITQKGMPFKSREWFISRIVHGIFSGRQRPQITETRDKRGLRYMGQKEHSMSVCRRGHLSAQTQWSKAPADTQPTSIVRSQLLAVIPYYFLLLPPDLDHFTTY